jgi:hypothetical protein
MSFNINTDNAFANSFSEYRDKKQIRNLIFMIHPHPYPDTFDFQIKDNYVEIIRTDCKEQWWVELTVRIFDNITFSIADIVIPRGNSTFKLPDHIRLNNFYNSMLVCIAFHYDDKNPQRLLYLHRVITNILNYPIKTEIIIDTNNDQVKSLLYKYKNNVNVVVHKLHHPYHLTWMHRKHMIEKINLVDIVHYVEDDIIISYESIKDYLEKIEYMWPKYVPCFERLEWSNNLKDYAVLDMNKIQSIKYKDIIFLNNKKYVSPEQPYHGFWILPTKFLKTQNLNNFRSISTYREHAASYLLGPPHLDFAWDQSGNENSVTLNKKPLLEISNDGIIHDKCLVYHISNNYADNIDSKFGKILVKDVLQYELPKTLVVILCETRDSNITFNSFNKHVIQKLNADLALCIGESKNYSIDNPLVNIAKYKFISKEYEDYGDGFDEVKKYYNSDKDWRKIINLDTGLFGGINHDPKTVGSGAILMYYRWLLLKNIKEHNLTDIYEWFIITRSDFIYKFDHPSLQFENPDNILIPEGEEYGGVTDRHIVVSKKHVLDAINLLEFMIIDPDKALNDMKKIHYKNDGGCNPERLIKYVLEQKGIYKNIKFFKRMMYTIRGLNTSTRWSPGYYDSNLGYNIKYPQELISVRKNCQELGISF